MLSADTHGLHGLWPSSSRSSSAAVARTAAFWWKRAPDTGARHPRGEEAGRRARRWTRRLSSCAKLRRSWRTRSNSLSDSFGAVASVAADSPLAGELRKGDLIDAIDGEDTRALGMHELVRALARKAGQPRRELAVRRPARTDAGVDGEEEESDGDV